MSRCFEIEGKYPRNKHPRSVVLGGSHVLVACQQVHAKSSTQLLLVCLNDHCSCIGRWRWSSLVQPVVGRGPAALTKAMTQSRGRRPLFLRNLLCVPSPWWYLKDGYEATVSGLLDNSRATAVVGDRAFTSPGVAIAAHLARTGFSRRPAQDCRG